MTYFESLGFIPVVPALLAPLLITKAAVAATGPSEESCAQNRDRAQASIDAATDEAAGNWRPTGFYRPTDMAKMRDQVIKMLLDASAACDDAISAGMFTYAPTLRMAQSKVQYKLRDSVVYSNAISTALNKGIAVIDSPSFKRWVVDSMNATSVAIGHVAYMACIKPALVSVAEKVYQVARGVITIAKTMIKVAIAAGQQVLKIPDTLETLWKWTKWGGLALLAGYAIMPKRKRPNPCGRRRR